MSITYNPWHDPYVMERSTLALGSTSAEATAVAESISRRYGMEYTRDAQDEPEIVGDEGLPRSEQLQQELPTTPSQAMLADHPRGTPSASGSCMAADTVSLLADDPRGTRSSSGGSMAADTVSRHGQRLFAGIGVPREEVCGTTCNWCGYEGRQGKCTLLLNHRIGKWPWHVCSACLADDLEGEPLMRPFQPVPESVTLEDQPGWVDGPWQHHVGSSDSGDRLIGPGPHAVTRNTTLRLGQLDPTSSDGPARERSRSRDAHPIQRPQMRSTDSDEERRTFARSGEPPEEGSPCPQCGHLCAQCRESQCFLEENNRRHGNFGHRCESCIDNQLGIRPRTHSS